jgi:hypothetical protein
LYFSSDNCLELLAAKLFRISNIIIFLPLLYVNRPLSDHNLS